MSDTGSKLITVLLIVLGALSFLPGLCVALFDATWGNVIVFGGWIMVAAGAVRITWRVLANSADQDVGPVKLAVVVVSWGILLFGLYLLVAGVSVMQQLGHLQWNH